MAAFIQLIELKTTRIDEVEALVADWQAATEGRRTAQKGTVTRDRDRPDTWIQIVEFPSYEDAMANSRLPETAGLAEQLAKLSDGPPVFRNLDVERVDDM